MSKVKEYYNELKTQAEINTLAFLVAAEKHIDKVYGVGYAKKNPALVAAFITTASQEFEGVRNYSRIVTNEFLVELGWSK